MRGPLRRISARIAALAAAMLALAACGNDPVGEAVPEASPPFYEIANADGEVEGWMLGTIHALPDRTHWRTEPIENAIEIADSVIVEVADLTDQAKLAAIYAQLATTPGLPDLSERVDADQRPALFNILARGGIDASSFGSTETWAAAIRLAQVGTTGDPANGVDRAVIADFAGRPVIELEGAAAQLAIFDGLAEQDQRDLLSGIITEFKQLEDDPARLRNAWLSGDETVLIEATTTGIMADAEVRDALLVDRNRDWTETLTEMLAADQRPLVAVGAAHLVGEDGLGAMLEAQGYSVRRVE